MFKKSTKLAKNFSVNRHLFSSPFSIIKIIKVETGDGNGTVLDLFIK
jgi:hypothetical protein